jgi:predicted phage terminase large subunit-like protein
VSSFLPFPPEELASRVAALSGDQAKRVLAATYEADSRRLAGSFPAFMRAAWNNVLEPTRPLVWNWHLGLMGEYLVAAQKRQIRKLIFNVPPRSGKSREVTVAFPVWCWINDPASRWIFISYSQDLTRLHSRERRDLMESDWFRKRWASRFALVGDQNVVTWYDNDKRGSMFSSSVGGTVTGKGGDFIVLDDPDDPRRAASEAERLATNEFTDQVIQTRLDDPKTGVQIIVQQRLHEDDTTGHSIKRDGEDGWTVVRIPMEAEEREAWVGPISGKAYTREKWDLLMDARFGRKEVDALKVALGSYGASGQLQQRPSPLEGGMVKRKWWREYGFDPTTAEMDEWIVSVDCAFKDLDESDYVVMQAWGRRGANVYLLDQVRDRMDFPETSKSLLRFTAKWPKADAKLVEDTANGPAVIAYLHDAVPGLIAIKVKDSKVARVAAASPMIEAGNVWIPAPAVALFPVGDFVEEFSSFPKVTHDDQVDAATQAIARLIGGKQFDLETWAKLVEARAAAARGLSPETAIEIALEENRKRDAAR